MSELIRVPDIGSGEGEVIEILVKVGDRIEAEQSLLTLESDKASMEIPAPKAGVIKSLAIKLGDRLKEGDDHEVDRGRRAGQADDLQEMLPVADRFRVRDEAAGDKASVMRWIETGLQEGAKLVLDGRDITVPGFENGFYLGPTILDHVTEGMTVGSCEIFGPVLCIKCVKDFEEGLAVMNGNRFANGSVIFTSSGYYSREFAWRTDGGMVGINVGIPVPVGIFPFSGHKDSFFGDLHVLGKDGVRFFTEVKAVTTNWPNPASGEKHQIDTWEGSVGGSM